jgi:hypothetical protein
MVRKLGIGCGLVILALIVIGVIGASNAPKTGTSTPSPTASIAAAAASPTVASSPTAPPSPTPFNFGSGKKLVPSEVPAGTYRMRTASPGCYWERLSGLGGTFGEILANGNASGPEIVTIAATDKAFNSTRCAAWSADLSAITKSPTDPFGDGTFQVGVDIAPGTWRSAGGTTCYWQRMSGFSGSGINEIIANDNTGPSTIVEIGATDKGFSSSRCGTWTKV